MKLSLLYEGELLRAAKLATGMPHKQSQINKKPACGCDSGARDLQNISQPSGVPLKPRHRKFLGMSRQFGIQPPRL